MIYSDFTSDVRSGLGNWLELVLGFASLHPTYFLTYLHPTYFLTDGSFPRIGGETRF